MTLLFAAIAGVLSVSFVLGTRRWRQPISLPVRRSARGSDRSWFAAALAAVLLATSLTVITSAGIPRAAEAVPWPVDPVWKDGRIAYALSFHAGTQSLLTVEADGSDGASFPDHPIMSGGPSWSPDGTKLAYTYFSGTVGANDSFGVVIRDADGTGLNEVLTTSMSPGKPTWSPDSAWLALTLSDNSGTGLYKIRTNGTQLTQILPTNARGPAWSPSGTEIALSRELTAGGGSQIVLVSPTGTSLATLTSSNADFAEARDPAWSPDGTRIAFTAQTAGGDYSIWVMNADGSGATRLADRGLEPEWAPNGALILFTRDYSPFVVPVTGGAASVLPNWEAWPFVPRSLSAFDWQPAWRLPSTKHMTGLVDPVSGKWHLYNEDGLLDASFYYGNPGDYPFVGDWNCNGIETPGLYRQSDGYVYLRNANTEGIADIKFYFGNPGDVPIAGDFNGNGCDTVSIYRPSNQRFYIINQLGSNNGSLGAAELDYVFGNPGDKPFVGDFDSDGIETVGLHRESTGFVYFRNTHTQGIADNQFFFGDPGDRLVAGDWNANGEFTPALFRPSNTTMYFRYTNTQGNADNEHIPIPTNSAWLPVSGRLK